MGQHGKLKFIYGTMSSGKSMRLITSAHNLFEKELPYLIFKSTLDTRDENKIHSRALIEEKDCISISPNSDLFSMIETYSLIVKENQEKMPIIIYIDEAQFLTAAQVDQLAAIADMYNIDIMCYGLRTDFQGFLFEGSKRLFEIADSFEEIKATCQCGSKTIFNARVDENKNIVTEGDQVEVGGNDKYISYCRKCFLTKSGHPLYNKTKE